MKTKDIFKPVWMAALAMAAAYTASADQEYHVSAQGNDGNDGSKSRMLRTISAAAVLARPGDVITVHEGVYRERVNPPRGGESDARRIVYQAAPGEKVVITGSEAVKGWVKVREDAWKVTLPNPFFGKFNPYGDVIHGDWFSPNGRQHHTGAVYVKGDWLIEAPKLDDVLKPAGDPALWFGQADSDNTTIWAQFKGGDPNAQEVEINVRQTVFYPDKPGVNYITVRGFTLCRAATPWAPPTAEQMGLIGTHWSKGWIIENNAISYSKCSGVALGKYGDEWDNRAESAEGYVGTINRALRNGWNKETIGRHTVRNNEISHCEQTGVVGSLGCSFSTVTGNDIHDIHVHRLFSGAEMAGIKFHGAIDVEISGNHIYRTIRGIWLDWMAQGAHVTGNLLHDNQDQDLFLEVDHGPFLVDNNLFLSRQAQLIVSQGGAYAHNLIAGDMHVIPFDARMTPLHKAHSTELAGLHNNPCGDVRYYNNLFVLRGDVSPYDTAQLPVYMAGNVFLGGAKPSKHETSPLVKADFDPRLKLLEKPDGFYLEIALDPAWAAEQTRKLVTTALLGAASIPNLPFENADGTPIRIDTDYFGRSRDAGNPFPGPFELPGGGNQSLKVWPNKRLDVRE
ncbi:MAG: right-handed parallel beta-helix repeat-containing protein [Limisphaerales bacterium]